MDRRIYLREGGPSPSVSRSSEKGGKRAYEISLERIVYSSRSRHSVASAK